MSEEKSLPPAMASPLPPKRSIVLQNATSSAAAGIVSRLLTHPLDTIKARLQATGTPFKGPLDVLRSVKNSPQNLYRGLSTVLVGGTPGTMLYLCTYDAIKMQSGGEDSSFMVHFVGGMVAEAVACIIYVPVDVLKERLQVQTTYKNSWHGLKQIMKDEGLRGLYRGYGATLLSFGPFSALYFCFYEQAKRLASGSEKELGFGKVVTCSCAAGATASWLTSPLDMAKLRLQLQRANPAGIAGRSEGMWSMLSQVYMTQGSAGLFRGAGARVLHFAPATTITMSCYESLRGFF